MNHTSGSNKQTTMAQLQMPDELSRLIQDFVRPNIYKKKYDAVVKQMDANGFMTRFVGNWDDGCEENFLTDWDWDILVCNGVAPQWSTDETGYNWLEDKFCVRTISVQLLWMIKPKPHRDLRGSGRLSIAMYGS